MKSIKQVKREARHLFQLCRIDGSLDEGRVREVLRRVLDSERRGRLALANQFERLVRLEEQRHAAEVESAAPLNAELQESVRASLARMYGPGLQTSFAVNPALIGGLRVRVGSDLYDGSVRAGLAELARRFEYAAPNGSRP